VIASSTSFATVIAATRPNTSSANAAAIPGLTSASAVGS
jgi:hypothetical protein